MSLCREAMTHDKSRTPAPNRPKFFGCYSETKRQIKFISASVWQIDVRGKKFQTFSPLQCEIMQFEPGPPPKRSNFFRCVSKTKIQTKFTCENNRQKVVEKKLNSFFSGMRHSAMLANACTKSLQIFVMLF